MVVLKFIHNSVNPRPVLTAGDGYLRPCMVLGKNCSTDGRGWKWGETRNQKQNDTKKFCCLTDRQPPEKRKEAGHNSGLQENNTLKIFLLVTATNKNRITKRRIPASHQFWDTGQNLSPVKNPSDPAQTSSTCRACDASDPSVHSTKWERTIFCATGSCAAMR